MPEAPKRCSRLKGGTVPPEVIAHAVLERDCRAREIINARAISKGLSDDKRAEDIAFLGLVSQSIFWPGKLGILLEHWRGICHGYPASLSSPDPLLTTPNPHVHRGEFVAQ
jgi:hypothetical protein